MHQKYKSKKDTKGEGDEAFWNHDRHTEVSEDVFPHVGLYVDYSVLSCAPPTASTAGMIARDPPPEPMSLLNNC